MPEAEHHSLWRLIAAAGLPPHRFIADADGRIAWRALDGATSLEGDTEVFRGACVMICAERQIAAVLAAVELDGVAARIVLCPPDLAPALLPDAAAQAGVDIVLHDGDAQVAGMAGAVRMGRCGLPLRHTGASRAAGLATEWVLFTSGTTGRPKMVIHTLAGLTGPLDDGLAVAQDAVWSTFYDIRRYGGLQILLRACLGGGSMVLSDTRETLKDFLARAGAARVSHISGTPSHWRRALMSGATNLMSPAYARLSGEVADQAILNNLRQAFPDASIAHAFASTEAGVAFDVRDGLAGFPESIISAPAGPVELRVRDGSLRIRSSRTAVRYIGDHAAAVADSEGFVDTGDMLEWRDGRYFFVGRREGIINVGGHKVHPEEVEAVVNQHPGVQMSRVRGQKNPITGAIVIAEFLRRPGYVGVSAVEEILEICRAGLPTYKVPAILREVETLEIGAAGKLQRHA